MTNQIVTYDEVAARTYREPVWLVDLVGRGIRISSGKILSATGHYFEDLIDEDGVQLPMIELDPFECSTSIGTCQITVSDIGRQISDLFALSTSFNGAETLVKLGWADVPESEYRAKFRGVLSRPATVPNHRGYFFELRDALTLLSVPLFPAATASSPVTLVGNPYLLILQAMASTGAGTNGVYDVLPSGLGIDLDQWVDVDGFLAQMGQFAPGDVMEFSITSPIEDAKVWFEQEILRFYLAHFLIDADGNISVRNIQSVNLPSIATPLDGEAWTDPQPAADWPLDAVGFNQVIVAYDYDATEDTYNAAVTVNAPELQNFHGRVIPKTIFSKGLRSTRNGETIARANGGRLLATFGMTPARWSLPTNLLGLEVPVGQTLLLTCDTLPKIIGGERLVLRRNIIPQYFLVEPRIGGNAPAGAADYADATDAEKLMYWFLCDENGVMPNGDPGYTTGFAEFGLIRVVDNEIDYNGIANIPVQIISHQADVQTGECSMTGITLLQDRSTRFAMNAPAGLPDYADQTDTQRALYWSLCDGETGLMPDGSAGYGIVT